MLPFQFGQVTNVAALCGAAITPQPEITQIVCVPDVGANLQGKYFSIYADGIGGHNGVYMNLGAAEVTNFNFTGLTGANFVAVGAGKYVLLSDATDRYAIWFNVDGANTAPVVGGATQFIEVPIGVLDIDTSLADTFVGFTGAVWNTLTIPATAIAQATDNVVGVRTDATAGTSPVTVTIAAQGRANATPPAGFNSTIEVPLVINNTATQVALALSAAMDGQGWVMTNPVAGTAVATDSVDGARPDASDFNTGFTITTPQQGQP